MIILILMALVGAHCVWLVRSFGRNRIAANPPTATTPEPAAPLGVDPDDLVGTTWSALDDQQLERLLKGSSS